MLHRRVRFDSIAGLRRAKLERPRVCIAVALGLLWLVGGGTPLTAQLERIRVDGRPEAPESTETETASEVPGREFTWREGREFTWREASLTRRARLQPELRAVRATDVDRVEDVVARVGDRFVVRADSPDSEVGEPVFRSATGEFMALTPGVILILDRRWSAGQVAAFLRGHGVGQEDVSELGTLRNAFLVTACAGIRCLELANRLAQSDGVVLASPNWRRQLRTR